MRLVKDQVPDLIDTATLLTAASPHAERLEAEIQADALLDRDPSIWNHPVQILFRPRRPYSELLAVCQRRLDQPCGEHSTERLLHVMDKLKRAIVLEERARRRREKIRAQKLLEVQDSPVDVH